MIARSLLALLVLAAAAHAEVGPGPYTLRFKPLPEPLVYHTTYKRATADVRAEGDPAVTEATTDVTLRMAATAKGDAIHREFKVLAGEKVPVPDGDVDALGQPLGADGKPAPQQLALVLPREAIPAGPTVLGQPSLASTTWTVEVPAHDDVPATRTNLRITGWRTAHGRDCVVVSLAATGSERVEQGKRLLEYWGKGEVLFDPAAGCIVEQRVEVRQDDAVWPPPKTGHQRTHREWMAIMTLVP